jgi:hypothetical protein
VKQYIFGVILLPPTISFTLSLTLATNTWPSLHSIELRQTRGNLLNNLLLEETTLSRESSKTLETPLGRTASFIYTLPQSLANRLLVLFPCKQKQ